MKYVEAFLLTCFLGAFVVLFATITQVGAMAVIADPANVGNWVGSVMMAVLTVGMATATVTCVRLNLQMQAKPVNRAKGYMQKARGMIREARDCRAKGYPQAAKAAIQAATSFRKAAHACWHYGQ